MSTTLRTSRHIGAAVALSLFGLLVASSPAWAHAQYDSSTPYSGAVLSSAPATLQVTWTQELASVQFTVSGPDGSDVVAGPARIDVNRRKNASVPLRDAGPGQYTVVWHNVSGEDGDPNDGSFVFSVAGAAARPAPAPVPAPTPAPSCLDNGVTTPGITDVRVNTYCKRQAIRDQYQGKMNEVTFNYDLSIGMGLESALADAMAPPSSSGH